MNPAVVPLEFLGLGPSEIVLVVIVVLLLFGAKKLPELARGSGRALRIFKAETKGLMDDDEDEQKTDAQREVEARRRAEADRAQRETRPDASPQPPHETPHEPGH